MKFFAAAFVALFAAPVAAATLTEYEAVLRVQQAITKGHWTNISVDCLSYEPVAPQWTFIVREEHNDACGGDHLTAPRLFTVHVEPQNGVVRKVEE